MLSSTAGLSSGMEGLQVSPSKLSVNFLQKHDISAGSYACHWNLLSSPLLLQCWALQPSSPRSWSRALHCSELLIRLYCLCGIK